MTVTDISRGGVVFLIPVVVAAIRWGGIAAIAAAIGGVLASIFFFYAPIYDFEVSNSQQIIELGLFIFVALVVSRLAAQLSMARVRAEGDTLRQALIDSVSHELRTPLASILGSATVIGSAASVRTDARLADLVQTIREEAERLDRDIQNLLDASRVTAEGIRPQIEPTDPADVINSALRRCRRRLGRHPVKTDIAPDLPFIEVDSALIEQALVQLLDNAAKYSPPASAIEIAAREDQDTVTVSVTDHGRGLTDKEINDIWNRRFRGDRHEGIAGSGLGLWIAKAFVTANNGELAADSAGLDLGSTITMVLPVSRMEATHESLDRHDD
jgi:two-component system sensor histidine kinase KdpD